MHEDPFKERQTSKQKLRNKSIIDTITKHNMSDQNILSMFYGKSKKIAIVMDEIDGMNSGDKGGINSPS